MKTMHVVAAAGAALILAIAVPASASAHISVSPNSASPGSFTLLDLKVPNESATEVATKVELSLPTDTPFTSVSYVPVAGWTTELVRETLPTPVKVGENTITEAVTSVTWTADPGFEIADGQLQVFPLSLGPVPDVGSIVFAADQTYSDGTVVSWAETGDDASHPAPVLYVNDAPPTGHHGDAEAEAENETEAESEAASGADGIARGLGIGGLVVGALGVAVAITALRRREVK